MKQYQIVYKKIGATELKLHIFTRTYTKNSPKRPAVIFFFGGGFNGGDVSQFFPQSKLLAKRGYVAICAEYRVLSRHGTSPKESVADGQSAVKFVRKHANHYAIDPDQIIAGGGFAGGQLALCTGLLAPLELEGEKKEDSTISTVPNGIIAFNPGVEVLKHPPEITPMYHIKPVDFPIIIFHGKEDKTVPFSTVEKFTRLMKEQGNRCDLVSFEEVGHGFFNPHRSLGRYFRKTIKTVITFLKDTY